jgi:hypothetical protein
LPPINDLLDFRPRELGREHEPGRRQRELVGRDGVATGFDLEAISVAREDFAHGEYSDAIGPEAQEVDPVNVAPASPPSTTRPSKCASSRSPSGTAPMGTSAVNRASKR